MITKYNASLLFAVITAALFANPSVAGGTYSALYKSQERDCKLVFKCNIFGDCPGFYQQCTGWEDDGGEWCVSSISDKNLPDVVGFGGTDGRRRVKHSGTDKEITCPHRSDDATYYGVHGIYRVFSLSGEHALKGDSSGSFGS